MSGPVTARDCDQDRDGSPIGNAAYLGPGAASALIALGEVTTAEGLTGAVTQRGDRAGAPVGRAGPAESAGCGRAEPAERAGRPGQAAKDAPVRTGR
jgi:hypothetical protein